MLLKIKFPPFGRKMSMKNNNKNPKIYLPALSSMFGWSLTCYRFQKTKLPSVCKKVFPPQVTAQRAITCGAASQGLQCAVVFTTPVRVCLCEASQWIALFPCVFLCSVICDQRFFFEFRDLKGPCQAPLGGGWAYWAPGRR